MEMMPAPLEVDVQASNGVVFEQVAVAEGVQAWSDSEVKFSGPPCQLLGGTLLRFARSSLIAGTKVSLAVSRATDARVYVVAPVTRAGPAASDNESNLACDLSASRDWLAEETAPQLDQALEFALFSTIVRAGNRVTLPEMKQSGEACILVVVPVSLGNFAVLVTSSAGPEHQRMEECVIMNEGAVAWRDREHVYTDVPACLLGGVLCQGTHKDVPEGTVWSVRPNDRARVYVLCERASELSGGLVDSLPNCGWRVEDSAAPRWHNSSSSSTMVMFSRDCPAGVSVNLPPTRGSATVCSIVIVPIARATVAPVEVSCLTSAGAFTSDLQVAPSFQEGTAAWAGDTETVLTGVPEWMQGAALVKAPNALPKGALFTARAAAASVVYALVDEEYSKELSQNLASSGWQRRDGGCTLASSGSSDGDATLSVYAKRVAAKETLGLPATADAKDKLILAVKVDVEAFEAGVETNHGLEFARTPFAETSLVWTDRGNRWAWLPTPMVGSVQLRGPFSLATGTKLSIWASATYRAYVIVEAEYSGARAVRNGGLITAMQTLGWLRESGSPTFGDNDSKMQVWSQRAPEGKILELPPIVGEAVFSIVVASVTSSPDRIAEELKKSFKTWDKAGRGAIAAKDLDSLLQTICPSLDKDNRQAILAHVDRAGSGRISYTDFADFLMLS
jgi:hypothetical protein